MEIESLISQINDLEEAVRQHTSIHRYQVDLIKDSSTWNQICSSLDVIGDTVYAISSYEEADFPSDPGLQYIYIYGLLQSLFLQQDALRHLSEAFAISYNPSRVLLNIRGIRNASTGHPTKQNQKGTRFYNHISRVTMSKVGFDLLRYSEARNFDLINVDIPTMIRDQLSEIITGYKEIADKLSEADKMHKEKFKESRLQDVFPSAMSYFFEKIGQGIRAHSPGDRDFGKGNLKHVKDIYEQFETALKERNELSDYTKFDLNEYHHAIKRIEEYFADQSQEMEESDGRIYLSYIRKEHENFVQLAQEIDENYQEKT
jgi:hypothetical protein